MRQLAFIDSLTGLPNRRLLIELLDKAVLRSQRHQQFGALLFLDLNHFKFVNDNYGHAVGDQLLVEVARRL
ncbi:GGDEF domain-containing protein, partial [Acinetobacter baumannii]